MKSKGYEKAREVDKRELGGFAKEQEETNRKTDKETKKNTVL